MTSTNSWLGFALASAFFAALTAIFGKLGVNEVNSNLATFIRTLVIMVFVAGVLTVQHGWESPARISRNGAIMLILSGVATGVSWLCYYKALQIGKVSQVAPVDKLSVVFVIILSVVVLGEALTWKTAIGGLLIVAGTLILAV
jgi:transporter family protein